MGEVDKEGMTQMMLSPSTTDDAVCVNKMISASSML